MTETAKERFYREELESIKLDLLEARPVSPSNIAKALIEADELPVTTDKLSVEKLQEQLENCIQTLIEASVAANITQDIVVGNLVDRKLADLAKTHKLAVDYIEKVTGKNIDVVLAENAALEAEEEQ